MKKIWATLLVLICALNALSISAGAAFAPQKAQKTFSSLAQIDSNSAAVTPSVPEEHSGDCGDRHPEHHQCHFGHCNFLSSEIDTPWISFPSKRILTSGPHALAGVLLSGPKKPPRA